MEAYIKPYKLVYTDIYYSLLVPPFAVGDDQLTELSAPVAEMIYADAFISGKFMKLFNRMPYNGGSEMSYMERLCDVWG